jgi:hypothetical protein
MLILLDPTCLIFFERGKEGPFNIEDCHVFKFKVCRSVHYHTFQINQPTRCNNFSSLLLDHDQHHCYHHAPTVKPEAATAVVDLLMMGVRTPETFSAIHKRQVINLRSCCI